MSGKPQLQEEGPGASVIQPADRPLDTVLANRRWHAYWHIDAFADRPFTGNQAAVIELDSWLSDPVLQAIAAENNFAETAFVLAQEGADGTRELRWFTPSCEIRLCGHATLASGHVLLERDDGEAIAFTTRQAGVLTVRRLSSGGYELALPAIEVEACDEVEWLDLFGAKPSSVSRNPLGYNVLHYDNADAVRSLQPNFAALAALGEDQYICTAKGDEADIISRVFVPGAGVDEDSVTGSAHAVLAPYWAPILGRPSFTAFQASQRGGFLQCRLEGEQVWLGGGCVTVAEGRYFVCG